jgi:phosphatidylglycerophosphate synthase
MVPASLRRFEIISMRDRVQAMAKLYRYQVNDKSILYPVLKRYLWGPAMRFVPRSWSANSMTLLGNLFSFIAFVFLAVSSVVGMPDEAFFLPAIALFIYLSLDNMDGQQARRAASSSPLGEFLDHWGDGFNVGLIVVGYGLAMKLEPYLLLTVLGLCQLAYYATMWEQRMTGWLTFGAVGGTEGVLLVCLMYSLVATLGMDAIVATPVLGPMTVSHCFAAIAVAGFAATVLCTLWRVRAPRRDFLHVLGVISLVALWYSFGELTLNAAAFLLLLSSALLGGRQIISHILDVPFRASEWVVMGVLSYGFVAATFGDLGSLGQAVTAWLLVSYLAIRLFGDFYLTTSRLADHLRRDELLGFYFLRLR